MKEFFESLRSTLNERVANPFSGSFILSWFVWNYKLILVLFSASKAQVKLSLVSSVLYPSVWIVFILWVVAPALTALFYVFIYPLPAAFMTSYSLKQARKLNEAKQRIYDETPLTLEESREIRRVAREGGKGLEDEIEKQKQVIKDLRVKEADFLQGQTKFDVDIIKLTREIETFQSELGQKDAVVQNLQEEVKRFAQLAADSDARVSSLFGENEHLKLELAQHKENHRLDYERVIRLNGELGEANIKVAGLNDDVKGLKKMLGTLESKNVTNVNLLTDVKIGLAKLHNEGNLIPPVKLEISKLMKAISFFH